MTDPRDRRYAELIVDSCLAVQPGWQVYVGGNPQARPLLEEICGAVARRGAYALLRVSFERFAISSLSWVSNASLELLAAPAPLIVHEIEKVDALVFVAAPDNTRPLPGSRASVWEPSGCVSAGERQADEPRCPLGRHASTRPTRSRRRRGSAARSSRTSSTAPCCSTGKQRASGCAGSRRTSMPPRRSASWERHRPAPFTRGAQDEGRCARSELPGGEFFGCPVEDSAEGEISFGDFPAVYRGREIAGIRLRFEGGVVVDASAEANEDYLIETLDTDPGARRLGELGIGCNPGITRYTKNTLFDEKMNGTVHLALGNSYTDLGGVDQSAIHWDIVKDLRPEGSRLEVDGVVVQQDGAWLV